MAIGILLVIHAEVMGSAKKVADLLLDLQDAGSIGGKNDGRKDNLRDTDTSYRTVYTRLL